MRQLARDLGVSASMIQHVASGKIPPGPTIAAALGYVDDGLRWVRGAKQGTKADATP